MEQTVIDVQPARRRRLPPGGWRRRLSIALLVALCGGLLAGWVAARRDPDFVASAVDTVRQVVGPAPVAAVEDVFYRAADVYNRLHYRLAGDHSGWQLAEAGTPRSTGPAAADAPGDPAAGPPSDHASRSLAGPPTLPVVRPAGARPAASATLPPTTPSPAPTPRETLSATTPLIASPALAGEGVWQPLGTAAQPAGEPILWQTVIRPDPARPFARVALVAMDLSRSTLHIVPGTREPVSDVPARGLRPGVIPPAVQAGGGLLAAWNGGFRAVHGHYGMMTDGVTWLPAQAGLATVALRPDGTAVIGAWGRGVAAGAPWSAWRQNNPPLIEDGQLNPDVIKFANTVRWGASIDGAVFIWRSGMGLSRGHRWLIYAAGNSLSVETLTRALQAAGAWDAMQLDVNASYERFVTFAKGPQTPPAGSPVRPLVAQKLIDQMQAGPTQFLAPYDRDFFYLTLANPTRQSTSPTQEAR